MLSLKPVIIFVQSIYINIKKNSLISLIFRALRVCYYDNNFLLLLLLLLFIITFIDKTDPSGWIKREEYCRCTLMIMVTFELDVEESV